MQKIKQAQKPDRLIVERKFVGIATAEELIQRLIKAHLAGD